jgi:hypothetical protein
VLGRFNVKVESAMEAHQPGVRSVYVRLTANEEAALVALSRAEDRPSKTQVRRLIREGLARSGYLDPSSESSGQTAKPKDSAMPGRP